MVSVGIFLSSANVTFSYQKSFCETIPPLRRILSVQLHMCFVKNENQHKMTVNYNIKIDTG